MKVIKIIGLLCLFLITFFYTEKVIDISLNQDEIMIKIKEYATSNNIDPQNAIIYEDTIIPGNVGKYIDNETSYKFMKKIGYFEPSLLTYKEIYPEISIHNNYTKYIIQGNPKINAISLIYILNNTNTLDKIIDITQKHDIIINYFVDSTFLNNNINTLNKINNNEIYNYGSNGLYTKDNLIITNNIINNKTNNKSIFCLFISKQENSLNNCANNKMHSILIPKISNYNDIKNNLKTGTIFLIDNTQELNNIIEYIKSKGYNIIGLSQLITE